MNPPESSLVEFRDVRFGYGDRPSQRFFKGIGGVIPNVVSINAESAPRRLRATLAIIAVGSVPLGGAIPGFVTAVLVPQHGWQIIFLIGGITPLVIALAAAFALPESIKYMALHERHRGKMEKLVATISPGARVPANARFVVEDEQQFPGFNPKFLFSQGLAVITPLLWLLFVINLLYVVYVIAVNLFKQRVAEGWTTISLQHAVMFAFLFAILSVLCEYVGRLLTETRDRPLYFVAEERTIKGSYLGSCDPARDIPRYIEMYRQGKLPIDRLLSERIGLDDINAGFDRLAEGRTIRQIVRL